MGLMKALGSLQDNKNTEIRAEDWKQEIQGHELLPFTNVRHPDHNIAI